MEVLMKYSNLTSKEFEIMKIFWQYDKPLTASEIITLSSTKTWSLNSLYPLLNKLLKKQFIEVIGNIRSTKAPARIFKSKITILDYSNMQIQSVFGNQNKRMDIGNFLSYFSNTYDNSDELIKEIEEWIKNN